MLTKGTSEYTEKLESCRKIQAEEYTLQTYLQEEAAKQESIADKINDITKKIVNDSKKDDFWNKIKDLIAYYGFLPLINHNDISEPGNITNDKFKEADEEYKNTLQTAHAYRCEQDMFDKNI